MVASRDLRIPDDFEVAWSMSDLVLKTENSGGKELHTSKHVLATFSPYFETMFFGNWEEDKKKTSLDMEDDYPVVLEVLRILHQKECRYDSQKKKYHSLDLIHELYRFGDKYDLAVVRKMCKEELLAQPGVGSLRTAVLLELDDVKAEILKKSDKAMMEAFIATADDDMKFDGKDLRTVAEKLKAPPCKRCANRAMYKCACNFVCLTETPMRYCGHCDHGKPKVVAVLKK